MSIDKFTQEPINPGRSFDNKTVEKIIEKQKGIKKVLANLNVDVVDKELFALIQRLQESGINNQETFEDFLFQCYSTRLSENVSEFIYKECSVNFPEEKAINLLNLLIAYAGRNKSFFTNYPRLQEIYNNLRGLFQMGTEADEIRKIVQDGIENADNRLGLACIKAGVHFVQSSLRGTLEKSILGVHVGEKEWELSKLKTPFNEIETLLNADVVIHTGERDWNVSKSEVKPFNDVDMILNPVCAVHQSFIKKDSGIIKIVKK